MEVVTIRIAYSNHHFKALVSREDITISDIVCVSSGIEWIWFGGNPSLRWETNSMRKIIMTWK